MTRKTSNCAICDNSNQASICSICVNYRLNEYNTSLKLLKGRRDSLYSKLSDVLVRKSYRMDCLVIFLFWGNSVPVSKGTIFGGWLILSEGSVVGYIFPFNQSNGTCGSLGLNSSTTTLPLLLQVQHPLKLSVASILHNPVPSWLSFSGLDYCCLDCWDEEL
ncbi:hypothetical protein V8G54_037086 [Vigna mungo]|uniref:Uncharacterized protein n=1 Tax=Vigna mungo TaxID=3915 RepID=A0AAQ3RG65_VIGMU